MAETRQDSSGVRFPPPALYAGLFAVGYAVHRVVPVALFPPPAAAAQAAGWCLVAVAAILLGSSVFLFRRAGTSPIPIKPTTALVVHGPYRFTRNPMYVGFAALYLGLTLLVNSLWPLPLFPVVIVLMQRSVIAREEAYLERTFGDEYRAYKSRVRRWM